VFHSIIIILKCGASVVRRIYEDAFDLPGELLLQSLERKQVITED